jgi:transcriptional regulator NrdR family protein
MKCRICNSTDHRVVETADSGDSIRRRRMCDNCRHRWTTFESDAQAIDVDAALERVRSLEAILTAKG